MAAIPKKIQTWQMVQPTIFNKETKETKPGRLEKTEIPVPDLKPGEVLVEDRRLWSMPHGPGIFL